MMNDLITYYEDILAFAAVAVIALLGYGIGRTIEYLLNRFVWKIRKNG